MLLTLDPEIWTAAQSQLNNELQKEIEQGGWNSQASLFDLFVMTWPALYKETGYKVGYE